MRQGAPKVPLWAWPALVVVVAGALGGAGGHERAVAVWIAIVCAWVAGVLVAIAIEPAPYARRAARAVGALVGLVVLALLLWQAGEPLL
jgi:hypothetical protein